jgi:hypothetical protein
MITLIKNITATSVLNKSDIFGVTSKNPLPLTRQRRIRSRVCAVMIAKRPEREQDASPRCKTGSIALCKRGINHRGERLASGAECAGRRHRDPQDTHVYPPQ